MTSRLGADLGKNWMQCAIPPGLVATVVSDCQKAARYHSRGLLFRLRQTVRDFNPRRFRRDMDMFGQFDAWIGIQCSDANAEIFWILGFPFENWRTTSSTELSEISLRRFPFFQQ